MRRIAARAQPPRAPRADPDGQRKGLHRQARSQARQRALRPICLNNGIRHLLTAPYSPTTTGKVERLHKTMRKEFFADQSFETIEDMQAALDAWVVDYNNEREHQSLGDVPPIRRFELARPVTLEVIDGEVVADPIDQGCALDSCLHELVDRVERRGAPERYGTTIRGSPAARSQSSFATASGRERTRTCLANMVRK